MWHQLKSWADNVPFTHPVERRLSGIVQMMLIGLVGAVAITLVIILGAPGERSLLSMSLGPLAVLVTSVAALAILRRGHFKAAVITAGFGLQTALVVLGLVSSDFLTSPTIVLAMTLPLAMVGLLTGRGEMAVMGIVSGVSVLVLVALEVGAAGFEDAEIARSAITLVGIYWVVAGLLNTLFDRVRDTLRTGLDNALARERELEELKESLEDTVAARTAELQAMVDQLQASQATIRELGSPVLPVLPGVLVAPLLGAIDSARAADLSAAVLAAIDRTRARCVILDITGVPVVDTHVARALLRVAQAAQLLGADALLVGVGAEVAQTMVALGVDLGGIRVHPNLQEAVSAILEARAAAQA